MLEYLTLATILIIFFLIREEHKILNLFLLLISFHSFTKSCFNYFFYGGEVFAFWKEIAIVILAVKVFKSSFLNINKQLLLTMMIYVFVILAYFLITNDLKNALPSLRDYLFPLIFFISIAKIKLNYSIIKKIIIVIIVSVLLTDVFGLIQYFFLNEQLSQIMGRINFIDSNGYILYNTSSARIMGFERMAGILGGGPNMFGVFNGFAIVFLLGVLMNNDRLVDNYKLSKVLVSVLILALICVILSFSRAGWFIAFLGVFILFVSNKKINRFKYFVILIFSSFFIGFILILYIPKAENIIYNSFTGKEESVAMRSEMITELIPRLLSEPFGHGIGTTDNRLKAKLFFSESAFTNIAFEIGILGFLLLIFMHFNIIKHIRKILNYNYFSKIAIAISIGSLIVSFVSINAFGMPYIYFWWFILGIGINRSNLKRKRTIHFLT